LNIMTSERDAIGALLDTYLGGGGDIFDPAERAAAKSGGGEKTLVGEAQSAMSGPILIVDGEAIEVPGVGEWPDEVIGRQVRVTGQSGTAKMMPSPVVGADGGISHGAFGSSQTLSGANWTLVE
jgi:hypothetical protein